MLCKDHTGIFRLILGKSGKLLQNISRNAGWSTAGFRALIGELFPVTPSLTSFFSHIHQMLRGTYIAHGG